MRNRDALPLLGIAALLLFLLLYLWPLTQPPVPRTEEERWQYVEGQWGYQQAESQRWRFELQRRQEKQWERDQSTQWRSGERESQWNQYWQEQRRP